MIIEVGMHTGKHRIKLTLTSEDKETHSFMADNDEMFRQIASDLADRGREYIDIQFSGKEPNLDEASFMVINDGEKIERLGKVEVKGKSLATRARRNPSRR